MPRNETQPIAFDPKPLAATSWWTECRGDRAAWYARAAVEWQRMAGSAIARLVKPSIIDDPR